MTPIRSGDVPWMHKIFKVRYPNNYDAVCADSWMHETVLKMPSLFLACRTEDAFLIAMLHNRPWLPNDFVCHVIVCAADHGRIWQCPTLLRYSIDWARRRRCIDWNFQSDTDHDIAPLMRRIGIKEIAPRYRMEL